MNVDLDIVGSGPLDALAEAMGRSICVLYSGPTKRKKHLLVLESSRQPCTPDSGARALCSVIERLSGQARRLWNAAERKEFNVGYDFHAGIQWLIVTIEPATLKRIAALGATLVFTCYPADDSKVGRAFSRKASRVSRG